MNQKTHQRINKITANVLSVCMIVSTAATAAATSVSAADVLYENPVLTDHSVGIIGGFNGWETDIAKMNDDDGDGVYVGIIENVSAGEYEFRIRLDDDWEYSWASYEEDYDRTFNSQTNLHVQTDTTTDIVVLLNSNGDDRNVWPVSFFTLPVGSGDTTDINASEHIFGVIGGFNEWSGDVVMTEVADGIYAANIGDLERGTEFKVRTDGQWNYSWAVYEADYDRTQNSQTNLTVSEDAKNVTVYLNTTGNDFELWEVSFSYIDSDGNIKYVNTGKDSDNIYTPEPPEYVFNPSNHQFGVIGSFNNWSNDVTMTETESGVYSANIGIVPKGTQLKVRADGNWDYQWGTYSWYDTESVVINEEINSDITVIFDTNGDIDYYYYWPVAYSYINENGHKVTVINEEKTIEGINSYEQRFLNELSSWDSVQNGELYQFYYNAAENYFCTVDLTEEQCDNAIIALNNLKQYLDSEGITSVSQMTSDELSTFISYFKKVVSPLSLTLTYNTSNGIIYIKDANKTIISKRTVKVSDSEIIESGSCGTNVKYELDNKGVLTISGSGEMDRYGGYWDDDTYEYVDKTSPFTRNSKIRQVIIKNGVTYIGSSAFYECANLKSVEMADSVTEIGYSAFSGCEKLSSINLSKNLERLGSNTFYNCGSLENITLPENISELEYDTFAYCESLTSIAIPKNVSYISTDTFYNCKNLQSINVAANNEYYSSQDGILYNKSKTEIVLFPINNSLTTYKIPSTVTTINDQTFYNCKNLTSVTIPNSVTEIKDDAFESCKSLTEITIPDSVTSIGSWAFAYCDNLKTIAIADSVSDIGEYAFYECVSLKTVNIPKSLKIIQNDTFERCFSLTSITIPNNVTEIKSYAFDDCCNLKTVKLSSGLKTISNYLFYNCEKLSSITIPYGVTRIENGAFEGCEKLKNVVIPNGVTEIADYAFEGCYYLESIEIPESVSEISDNAFWNCYNLQIHGVRGSYAEEYADENDIPFAAITPQLTNNSTINTEQVAVGGSFKITPNAYGGKGGYTYAVYYKQTDASTWTKVQDYQSTITPLITPKTAANYTIRVKLKDSGGTIVNKDFKVAVTAKPVNNTTINQTTINLGDSFKLTGKASGGSGVYTYAVYYKQASQSNWTKAQDYQSSITAEITPKAATNYNIRVKLKDSNGNVTDKNFTVKVNPKLNNNTTIDKNSIILGGSFKLTGKASGGSGGYTYAVYYRQTSQTAWTKVQDYQSSISTVITPKAAKNYIIRVKLKDSNGNVTDKDFDVKVNNELKNNSTIASTSVYIDESLQLTGKASGGSGDYQYAVYYKQTTQTTWTKAQDYQSTITANIVPMAAKNYNVRVKVKDSDGNVANKDFTVNVNLKYTNRSKIDSDNIFLGESITVTGGAIGGSGGYTYAVYYKKLTASSWTKVQDYAAQITKEVQPKSTGDYIIRVKLKDSSGSILNKDFIVTVNASERTFMNAAGGNFNVNDDTVLLSYKAKKTGVYTFQFDAEDNFELSYGLAPSSTPTSETTTAYTRSKPYTNNTYTVRLGIKAGEQYDFDLWRYSQDTKVKVTFSYEESDYNYDVNYDGTVTLKEYLGSAKNITVPSTINGKTVTSIQSTFYGNSTVKSVVIPNTVTEIGYYTFNNCTDLTNVTIPDSVTVIEWESFHNCQSLKNITIPSGVTYIGGWAFSDCSSLTSITLPNGIASIGEGTFDGCTALTSVIIPSGITGIGNNAFYNCESLKNITIPSGVTYIGDWAFCYCSSLTSVTIPNTVTEIQQCAFYNCNALKTVTIPSSVTSIEDYALGYHWNDDTYDNEKINNFTIRGSAGSAAETYANNNGFTFSEIAKLTDNGSNVSNTQTTAGSKITVTAKFTGGTAPYQYLYAYQKDGGSWTTAKTYSTASSAAVTLPSAGSYKVRIKCKDADGTIVNKDFTVKVTQ